MASKDTPKKLYKKRSESTANTSRCRLCNCVTDPDHNKRLFRAKNQAILRSVESLYGSELIEHNELPRLICWPCERRLNNVMKFKNVIAETQRELQETVRTKRCVEVSPSILKPPAKVHSAGDSRRRRSIDFSVAGQENVSPAAALSTVNVSSFNKHRILYSISVYPQKSFQVFIQEYFALYYQCNTIISVNSCMPNIVNNGFFHTH